MRNWTGAAAAVLALAFAADRAEAGSTLDSIKARGQLACGVSANIAGFASSDRQGKWKGLEVDVCRAMAAAILGSAEKAKYVPVDAAKRFSALQAGEFDVLVYNATHTLLREATLGVDFTGVYYYDGQGFMVSKKHGGKTFKQLERATICVQPGTTTELNLTDYFRGNKIRFTPLVIEKIEDQRAAFFAGRCEAMTADVSSLYATRAAYAPKPDDYFILPQTISKEPLGPVVRQGDSQFSTIVRWALYAMIEAEEQGITSTNVDQMLKSDDPTIKRILGVAPGMGKALGLDERWAYNIVKQVGNYSEAYDRNVGSQSPLKIPRGVNALWIRGGMLYAPPIR